MQDIVKEIFMEIERKEAQERSEKIWNNILFGTEIDKIIAKQEKQKI